MRSLMILSIGRALIQAHSVGESERASGRDHSHRKPRYQATKLPPSGDRIGRSSQRSARTYAQTAHRLEQGVRARQSVGGLNAAALEQSIDKGLLAYLAGRFSWLCRLNTKRIKPDRKE